MREDGFVSLWVGNAPSDDSLQSYVEIEYSDDGDAVPSRFMTDFQLPRWDEDFREAQSGPTTRRLSELLRGSSYEDQIIFQFELLVGLTLPEECNVKVLLYDFNHSEPIIWSNTGEVQLRFIGVVQYEK